MAKDIVGVNHVTVYVTDVERAHKFYTETLGMDPSDRITRAVAGNLCVTFQVCEEVPVANPEKADPSARLAHGVIGPHFALTVLPEAFHRKVEGMKAAGTKFIDEPLQMQGPDGPWQAFCEDPDGNTIELTDEDPRASLS